MDLAEGSAKATLVITCSFLSPQACLLWMPMTLKVSQSPSSTPLSQVPYCLRFMYVFFLFADKDSPFYYGKN